jgi:hypothetical protein
MSSQPERVTLEELDRLTDGDPDRPEFERARYRGQTGAAPEPDSPSEAGTCERCGFEVGAEFARVLGDNDDRIHACPQCTESWSDIRYEASGREHPTYRVPFEEVFE